MNLNEAIEPDSVRSVAFELAMVAVRLIFLSTLMIVGIGSLCLASVIQAGGLWVSANLATFILMLLSALAFGLAYLLTRPARRVAASGPRIGFCAVHRKVGEQ